LELSRWAHVLVVDDLLEFDMVVKPFKRVPRSHRGQAAR
jgi:hypothetical protein